MLKVCFNVCCISFIPQHSPISIQSPSFFIELNIAIPAFHRGGNRGEIPVRDGHRRILNSPALTEPWIYIQKNWHTGGEKMSKHVGEALNPTHSTATPTQEGTRNLELFPKEGRVWTPHWLPQHLRSTPERWAPSHRGFIHKTHKSIVKWQIALQGLVQVLLARSQSRGSQVKSAQSFCEGGQFKEQASNSIHI